MSPREAMIERRSRKVQVLLALELRYYRDTLAEALRMLHPEVKVTTAKMDDLTSSIRRLAPDIVICSEATEAVRNVPVWVELYPEHGTRSVVSTHGRREKYDKIEFSDLLSIVDQAKGFT